MYTISKEFHFSASHILHGLDACHPCSRLHGHNYVIVVELSSEQLNSVGFVKDYRELEPIKKWIDETLDHQHLNEIFHPYAYSGGKRLLLFPQPSAENMARVLFGIFQRLVPDVTIHSVTVKETQKTAATFKL